MEGSKMLPKIDGDGLRVVIVSPPGFIGERALFLRIMELLGRRGHECCLCGKDVMPLLKKINQTAVIIAYHDVEPPRGVPSLRFLLHKWHSGSAQFRTASHFENIIHGTMDVDELKNHGARNGKRLRSMPLLLSVKATEFHGGPKRKVFFSGACHGGDSLRGKHHVPLYALLDSTGYFESYGPKETIGKFAPKSYGGCIEDQEKFLELMKAAGVALVLHQAESLRNGTISSRIFEAVAASCVIISDRHPFVVRHFGDSALYIDHDVSPEEMFRQIDDHVQWILANPNEAIELARRSHDIFSKKFPLENEVCRLENFIREIARYAASHAVPCPMRRALKHISLQSSFALSKFKLHEYLGRYLDKNGDIVIPKVRANMLFEISSCLWSCPCF